MDVRFRDLDPRPGPVAPQLAAASEALERATKLFLSIPDEALEREWPWIGEGETDVRSGFYIALEELLLAMGKLGVGADDGSASGPSSAAPSRTGDRPRPAAGALAAATAARWELHGVLAPLDDALLDTDPGGGEWTIRQTLAHTVAVQRAYPYFSAWWITQRDQPDYAKQAPDSLDADLPSEEANASGSVTDIRRRLDALMDLSLEVWRDATDDDLQVRARWSGFPVKVGFRLGRWGPHIEEHTLQIEKTLAMLGRAPTEVERLVRLVHRGMGRLDAAAWMLPPEALQGRSGAAIESAATEVERIATEIAQARSADRPRRIG